MEISLEAVQMNLVGWYDLLQPLKSCQYRSTHQILRPSRSRQGALSGLRGLLFSI